MKKIQIVITIMLLLIVAGCSNSKPVTIEDLKANYESDKTNVDNAAAYIDTLLLMNNKEEAYSVLREASENVSTIEELNKLKDFTKYLDIRLVKIENYYNDKLEEISEIRYDENGRIIQYGNTTRIYPDDGGECYYYTLNSWYEIKNLYDKKDNLLASYYGRIADNQELGPYDDYYNSADFYEYIFNDDESLSYCKETKYIGTDISWIRETEYTYDDDKNLVKIIEEFSDLEYQYKTENVKEYTYDNNHNLTYMHSISDGGDSYDCSYENYYDEFGTLVKTTTMYGGGYSNSITYKYDNLYDVILTEENESLGTKIYYYELITSDAKSIGLNKDSIVIVSGDATRAVTKRIVTASNIKVRKEPTTKKDNAIDLISKGDIVEVYDSVYGEGYIWHEIGINQWFADDGTWTELYEK